MPPPIPMADVGFVNKSSSFRNRGMNCFWNLQYDHTILLFSIVNKHLYEPFRKIVATKWCCLLEYVSNMKV